MFRCLAPLLLSGCLVPDAMVERYLDQDGDGERPLVVNGTDCDDHNLHVGETAPEICGNLVDDDCNGLIDEDGVGALTFFVDGDGDGYGDPLARVQSCTPTPGTVTIAGDCDDNNRFDSPEAVEDCTDGRDNDCDRVIDEADAPPEWFADIDEDGFGDGSGPMVVSCTPVAGHVTDNTDCDDHNAGAWPGATEVPYDDVDNACDGGDDFDLDGDTFPVDPASPPYPILAVGHVFAPGTRHDCNDLDASIQPNATDTPYDGVDTNCDEANDFDLDRDGHVDAGHGGDDCDDTNRFIHPAAPETPYDGVDSDCVPANDDDADADGHPAASRGGDDCNDSDARVWSRCVTCGDGDLDGRMWGCDDYGPSGEDCNDVDPNVWVSCATCGDDDGDGRYAGCDDYFRITEDCDDDNPLAWSTCDTCRDEDGDGRRGVCNVSSGAPSDCDDTLANAWMACATCTDLDGDGHGLGVCDGVEDCDDLDANSVTGCGDCIDEDGDHAFVGCDRYANVRWDCDDADPSRGGTVHEIAEDGIDQDCDGEDLTVDEDHGVFVSAAGIDDPWCGTRAWPCATLSMAAQWARDRGVVLFVASGTFDAAQVYSGMYGGFDPATWTRPGGAAASTTVRVSATSALEIIADTIALDQVHVRAASSWTGGHLVRLTAPVVTISGMSIEARSLVGACRGLSAVASVTTVNDLSVDVTCRDGAVGWDSEPFDTRHPLTAVQLTDVSLVATATTTGEARGLGAVVGEMRAERVKAAAVGVGACVGAVLTATPDLESSVDFADAEITCFLPTAAGEAYGLELNSFDSATLVRILAQADGGSRTGAVQLRLPNVDHAEITSSVLTSTSYLDAYAVLFYGALPGPTQLLLAQDTLITSGVRLGMAVDTGPDSSLTVVNTAVSASHVGINTWAMTRLHGVMFEVPCAMGDRNTCDATTSDDLNACTWFHCVAADHSSVQGLGLQQPGLDPWIPASTSSLIDAGVDTSSWTIYGAVDLNSVARPRGAANDVGAIEVR